MRKFVANTALFISMPVLAMFFLLLVVEIESQYQYRLDADVEIVVLGDSHIQSALDIAHLEHCINLSINAESTYFSYYRLKKLLALNPNIRRVYLGFGCHNISSYYEDFIQGPYSENIASRYFPTLPIREKISFLKFSGARIPFFVKDILKYNLLERNYGYHNRFDSSQAEVTMMDERLTAQYYDEEGEVLDFSGRNIEYLKKFVELCQEKEVQLILIDTPTHSYYFSKIPQVYQLKYDRLVQSSGLKRLVFPDLPLSDDCFIPDGDHLSVEGSKILTQHFIEKFLLLEPK